ncbi:MAG: beta/alpha barrel domain-containing protein [Terriglobales bacterium]
MDSTDVTLIECPRDALQGLPQFIPTALKIELLQTLLNAGLSRLDCVSFVSPRAVPQMADSEAVLAGLGPLPTGTELIGIILNRPGLERALRTSVTTLGYPLSVSPSFQWENARQTPIQARTMVAETLRELRNTGRHLVVYLSMAFGNPHGDAYSPREVTHLARELADMGVSTLSLADTVGLASPSEIAILFDGLQQELRDSGVDIGLHLHSRREAAAAKITAGYRAGCRRFDTAVAGLGGCPFAGDALVGNIPTEEALSALHACGAQVRTADNPDATNAMSRLEPALHLARQLRDNYGVSG